MLEGARIEVPKLGLTVNNPALKPQTSKNWDATLEYYFEPVGALTLGWFHKEIRDFIITNQEVGIMKTVNLGFGYQYRQSLGLTVDLADVFNEPQEFYMGYTDRYRQNITTFVTVAIGLNGRF